MNLQAGTYSNTVRYTATTNLSSIPSPTIISITPDSGTIDGDTAIEIVGTGFTANNASVTTAVTLDGIDCANVTISSNTPTTGQDTIYCNTPANEPGFVDVVVSTWGGTAIEVDGYEYAPDEYNAYVFPSIASTIPGSESGPAFTIIVENWDWLVDEIVDIFIQNDDGSYESLCESWEVLNPTNPAMLQVFCIAYATLDVQQSPGAHRIYLAVPRKTVETSAYITYSDTAYPTLQSFNAFANCTSTPTIFRDTRDSQLYYVRLMEDGKCWMVDNLKYANFGEHVSVGNNLTQDGTTDTTAPNMDVAMYADPGATNYCMGNADMPANTVTRCGLFYNWYTATRGTGDSTVTTDGANVSGSICPANFRLPRDGVIAANNDFAILNGWMAGLGAPSFVSTSVAGWLPNGFWRGVFSGTYTGGFGFQGSSGFYQSSTSGSATFAFSMSFSSSSITTGMFSVGRYSGWAVRCVMDAPTTPPPPTNLPFGVLDVTPTTGWAGSRIDITSNNLFTNVTSVTVGGESCTAYEVMSTSQIACALPARAAGSVNNIVIINNGTDVANASTNNHMRITYFDPNRTETVGAGTTPRVYFNHADTSRNFTSDDCGDMTLGQIVNLTDIRNNQTYRVKKMTNNANGGRCWMIDNLKFPNGEFTTSGSLTVDGTTGTGGTNQDVAKYVNPMGQAGCIGNTNMPSGTLTRCGYLYNWFTATYGTGNVSASTQFTNVNGSICPNDANPGTTDSPTWKIPTGIQNTGTAGNGDFAWLNALMNNQSATASATTSSLRANWLWNGQWQGIYSGAYVSGFSSVGSNGYYWSSTAISATNAYGLYFDSSGVNPGNLSNLRQYGYAVRCVMP